MRASDDWAQTTVPQAELLRLDWSPHSFTVAFDEHQARRCGRVSWGALYEAQPIGIAWRWAELEPQVLVFEDVMKIETNIALERQEGQPSNVMTSLFHALHTVIYTLPWQDDLLQKIKRPLTS